MALQSHPDCQLVPSESTTRRFDFKGRYGSDVRASSIEVPWTGFTFLACTNNTRCPHCHTHCSVHENQIVVCVEGYHKRSQIEGGVPKASVAVYFGRGNIYNTAERVHHDDKRPATGLWAAKLALERVRWLIMHLQLPRPLKVVIKTSCLDVVKGTTEYYEKWQENGWKSCKGQTVVNADHYKALHSEVEQLEQMDVQGLFWYVDNDDNKEIHQMAREAVRNNGGRRPARGHSNQ